MRKVRKIAIRKEEHDKEKACNILKAKEKRNELFQKMLENKEQLKKEREYFRSEILETQNALLERSMNKDSVTDLKRVNAHELVVVHQMNLHRNLSHFNMRMNKIKNNSIVKIPMEKRLQMYKEMKMKEAEKRKREDEGDKPIKFLSNKNNKAIL